LHRHDRLVLATTRLLLASALIGACLLCEAAALLGWLDGWLRIALGACFG